MLMMLLFRSNTQKKGGSPSRSMYERGNPLGGVGRRAHEVNRLTKNHLPLIKAMLQQKLRIDEKEVPIHPRNTKVMNQFGISSKLLMRIINDVPIDSIRALDRKGTKYVLGFAEYPFRTVKLLVELEMVIDRHGLDVEIAKIHVKF
jgi:CRISPR/Cas system CMR-associated protein Cmr3 (group 5 of RAMP superfamily)